MSYPLTLTSATFNTSGKFGSSLNGGYGLANGVLSGTKITIEAWVKGSANSTIQVAAGQGNCLWVGMDSNGNAAAHYGAATDVDLTGTTKINDGAWHHLSLNVDSSAGGSFYVDGVLVKSSTTASAFDFTSAVGNFGVRNFPYGNGSGGYQLGFAWAGEVDEVAIYSGIKRTANFTPPTAATSNTDTNLLALWHLDGNGTDSTTTATPPVSIAYNDATLLYSPYNWDDRGTYMVTAAAGAYIKFGFTGTSVTFGIDVSNLSGANIAAGSYPIVRTLIDGLYTSDVPLTPSTTAVARTGLASGSHTVELILLATDDSVGDQWGTLTNALRISGVTIDNAAAGSKPTARSKNAIMFGDSIWRGYMSVGTTTTQPGSNNAAYSVLPSIARAFDCEFGAVAYSGQGYEQTGNASVVPFMQAYGLYSANRSRLASGKFSPAPDFIFVEHGTNGTVTSSDVQTMIANLRAAAPLAKIIQMIPVGGINRANITSGFNAAADSNSYLIDLGTTFQVGLTTYGTGPNALSIDGLHPNLFMNSRIAAAYCAKTQAALDAVAATTNRTFSIALSDASGPVASASGLAVHYYDKPNLGTSNTTDASGNLALTAPSTLASGATGYASVVDPATGRHWSGPVQVS